ncbi:hypothetical protein LZ017_15255 [Pelomonas sp. CA6]|uniref:hypothetical protein n=1 Tax=Pelomonas sp. CA6 TaxID=2907999 RepID=UPI001F4C1E2A|nr:hypothetical protein [Pelomonas sp. CA6]MCH7344737.1 hypothetical protein [Pelomonas sp. CA6]
MTNSSAAPPPAPPGEADASPPLDTAAGWLGGLQALLAHVLGLLGDGLDLLSLELQRALRVLERLLWLALLGGVAFATAWLFFWAGLASVLFDVGMPLSLACALIVFANAALLTWALGHARLLKPLLALPATRRQLGLGSRVGERPAAPPAAAPAPQPPPGGDPR